jgi:hypothetical protein
MRRPLFQAPSPYRMDHRRGETAAAALVLPDSGYLSWKIRDDAVPCAFGP